MLVPVETTVIVRGERQKRTVYMRKSLTWSGHKLQGRTTFQGLNISIENRAGTYRQGTDPDGHEWKTKLHNDYGYIRGSVGVDGDHVDCFIGPDRDSRRVYIIHQVKPGTRTYDEDKVMLGFSGELEAKKAYLSNYDRSDMFGSMETVTIDQLKSLIERRKGRKLTKAISLMLKARKFEPGHISIRRDGLWRKDSDSRWTRIRSGKRFKSDYGKAPNGKPSQLPDGEWEKTRSQKFKDWFGDWESVSRKNHSIDVVRRILSQEIRSDVVRHPLIGDIEIIAGKKGDSKRGYANGYGVDHILARRMLQYDDASETAEILAGVATACASGDIGRIIAGAQRVELRHKDIVAIVSLNKNGEHKRWLLTGYRKSSDDNQVSTNHDCYARDEPGCRRRVVAELLKVSSRNSDEVKPVSKVVDRNGEPLIVYHGTPHEFSQFDTMRNERDRGYFGVGAYFSSSKTVAGSYGKNLKPVYLSLKNPMEINVGSFVDYQQWRDMNYPGWSGEDIRAALEFEGYDGVIVSVGGEETKEYVAFYPEQIKPASSGQNRGAK